MKNRTKIELNMRIVCSTASCIKIFMMAESPGQAGSSGGKETLLHYPDLDPLCPL